MLTNNEAVIGYRAVGFDLEFVYTTLASLFACMPCLPSGLQRAMNCSSSRFARCTKLVWWHAAANPLRLATACVLGSRHHISCVMCHSANVAGCPPACTYSMRYFVHANSRHCVDKPGLYSMMSLCINPLDPMPCVCCSVACYQILHNFAQ